MKYDNYLNPRFVKRIKKNPTKEQLMPYFEKYPEILDKVFDCKPNFNFPPKLKRTFPRRTKITKLYYYLKLKLKYFLMEFNI